MNDSTTPATVGDVQGLRDDLQDLKSELATDMERRATSLKSELTASMDNWATSLKSELTASMDRWALSLSEKFAAHTEELRNHMDVLMENYTADLRGASKDEHRMLYDRQANITKRVQRLEAHVGI